MPAAYAGRDAANLLQFSDFAHRPSPPDQSPLVPAPPRMTTLGRRKPVEHLDRRSQRSTTHVNRKCGRYWLDRSDGLGGSPMNFLCKTPHLEFSLLPARDTSP